MVCMGSDNPSGADNQQERPGLEQWIVGFVDGEGCFSVTIVRNHTCRLGWQAQHEFAVAQAASSRGALDLVQRHFGCGRVQEQQRHDDQREPSCRFSVKRRADLVGTVVPVVEEHPLITAKRANSERFRAVFQMMERGEHLTEIGLRRIPSITESMNRRQRSRFLESSEAIRQPPRTTAR